MKSGQTLVILLVFMAIAITVTSTAVVLSIANTQNATRLGNSYSALSVAESGMENALLNLLRNPSYSGGETLSVGDGTATINISGTNPLTISSVGTVGDYKRTVVVTGSFEGVIFNINSWQQSY